MTIFDEVRGTGCQSFDPYDVWSSPYGVVIRRVYYSGHVFGKLAAIALALADWLTPGFSRRIIRAAKRSYPIVAAQRILMLDVENRLTRELSGELASYLTALGTRCSQKQAWAWGLGFPWMSKNGLYGPDVPFVTHTPYVMEALLVLSGRSAAFNQADEMFHGTWRFLESLLVMYEDQSLLALSYAPVEEPRSVVNANSYAAFAYALHAVHGRPEVQNKAREKAKKLINWVIRQQQKDGSWFYYADEKPGNFIDCFHSCFVVKNLIKVSRLVPEFAGPIDAAVDNGWQFIEENFHDSRAGLCRRFMVHAQRDPYRWDLYDQAEYLGLLVDFGEMECAERFVRQVEDNFRSGENWFCRIDIFGRRWGKNFIRWGIAPFLYHRARWKKAAAEVK